MAYDLTGEDLLQLLAIKAGTLSDILEGDLSNETYKEIQRLSTEIGVLVKEIAPYVPEDQGEDKGDSE